VRLGVCYYPEQWPQERWGTDAAMMAELGLELVRIGEFAWSRFEPARDRFDWGWLDEAIDTLSGAGLQIVLGTPTATPPIWLANERPDILSVGPDGRRRAYGSRRHTSPSSAAYREESRRIVTALVERYGHHPAIVAWQLDNEPGNHDSARCWSDASQAAFTRWLVARYGTIEALNDAWGTVFWSGTYGSFEEVRLPVPTVTAQHPSLLLAHLRFASEQATDGLAEQHAIVAAGAPGRDIFTNLYLGDVDVDGQAVARPNGLGALDLYPHGLSGPHEVGFVLDLARGTALPAGAGAAARGGRAWVTEQQPGPVNWTGDNPAVPPGQVHLWSWQVALHGIEGLLWFRWRAARAGQEQHHAALLRHDGSPDHAYTEVARFVREVRAADAALLERPPATTALVYDYGDAWLLGVLPHVEPGPTHRDLAVAAHTAARRLGLDVDVVPTDADLTGYDLILAPALHQLTPDRLGRLDAALDCGATLVLGPRSLVRDEHGVWVDVPLPGGLAQRLGARVDHAGSPGGWPRAAGEETVVGLGGETWPSGGWIETLEVASDDLEVLGRGVGGPLARAIVVARRGNLVFLGAASPDVWTRVLADLTGRAIHPVDHEVFERAGDRIAIDHTARSITLANDRGRTFRALTEP
jgi:beta-galactosidase